jgi:hypothetical protein
MEERKSAAPAGSISSALVYTLLFLLWFCIIAVALVSRAMSASGSAECMILIGLSTLTISIPVYSFYVKRKARCRQQDLMRAAHSLGLDFRPEIDTDSPKRFAYFRWFGGAVSTCNVMSGSYKGRRILGFDIWGSVQGGKKPYGYCMSAIVAPSTGPFPGLEILPEELADKMLSAHEDIDFESDEFSRKFYVRCPDRRFAYETITPRMMSYLLAHSQWWFELSGTAVLIFSGQLWTPERFREALDVMAGFLDLIPKHVLKERMAMAAVVREERALQVEKAMAQKFPSARNAPCPCGSGKKFKWCHGREKDETD